METNNDLLSSNMEYTKKVINSEIDKLYNKLQFAFRTIDIQKERIKHLQFNNVALARAYAKKLGILLTQKQFNRRYKKVLQV